MESDLKKNIGPSLERKNSITIVNRNGDKGQPCHRPRVPLKNPSAAPLTNTEKSAPETHSMRILMALSRKQRHLRAFSKKNPSNTVISFSQIKLNAHSTTPLVKMKVVNEVSSKQDII